MKKIRAVLSSLMICFCLTGCPSPADESKEAEKYVEQAISLTESSLKQYSPDAIIDPKSFRAISGVNVGPDHALTDWVRGQYKDGGIEDILINVITEEIYSTAERDTVSRCAMQQICDAYNTDSDRMQGSVEWTFEVPYCSDSDKYGDLIISNMLPIDVSADRAFVEKMMTEQNYHKICNLQVDEDFDMNIFGETDISSLGTNIRVYVEQYSKDNFELIRNYGMTAESITDEPLAIFDSE